MHTMRSYSSTYQNSTLGFIKYQPIGFYSLYRFLSVRFLFFSVRVTSVALCSIIFYRSQ